MTLTFRDRGSEDIFDGDNTKAARRTLPVELHDSAAGKLDRINSAVSLNSLSLPGLNLEPLKGDRIGQYSIRINRQYRICFRWTDKGAEDIEIVDYH